MLFEHASILLKTKRGVIKKDQEAIMLMKLR